MNAGELAQAFVLGNSAILTNVCVLPLYPGMMAFLAGRASDDRHPAAAKWLGLAVLAGVLSMMTIVGWLLYRLQASFGDILPVLLPVIYSLVGAMGLMMLTGRNPFGRVASFNRPAWRHPLAAAYAYGLLLGPMTLPCAGPIVLSAFLIGAGSSASLAQSLLYFFAFGLGFGWPLVLLPLVAQPAQRRFTGWMTRHQRRLTLIAGALLLLIAGFGIVTEIFPNLP